jgi:hypothetical protein
LNRRPLECKTSALPAELKAQMSEAGIFHPLRPQDRRYKAFRAKEPLQTPDPKTPEKFFPGIFSPKPRNNPKNGARYHGLRLIYAEALAWSLSCKAGGGMRGGSVSRSNRCGLRSKPGQFPNFPKSSFRVIGRYTRGCALLWVGSGAMSRLPPPVG